MTNQEFLDKLGPMARKDMRETGILASLTMAQGILESGWGQSGLTKKANNLFGIKGSYNGQSYECNTFEYINGKRVETKAKFRKYPSWQESVADHSSLFLRLDRYANLRGETDYKNACWKVQEDGYATAPNYAESLIRLIEQYNLTQYDKPDKTEPEPFALWKIRVQHFSRIEDAKETAGKLAALGLYGEVQSEGEKYVVDMLAFCPKEKADALAWILSNSRYSVVQKAGG